MTTASTPAPVPAAGSGPDPAPVPSEGASTGVSADRPLDRPARRVAFLDVARALAMIGVVMMNAPTVVFALERGGGQAPSALTSVVDTALSLLMSGRARSMLMVLLGVGAVLAWQAAERRGGRPMTLMLWRYALLGVVFGVPHFLAFPGDILTLYSVAGLVLAPLLPLLLGGSRRRPLLAAVALFAAAPFLELLVGAGGDFRMLAAMVPQTLGFFCVGVWLARRPELAPDFEGPTRLPLHMMWVGALLQGLGLAVMFAADLFFPMEFDASGVPVMGADGMPVVDPGSQVLVSMGAVQTGLGGALLYLGLVWWLVRRGRAVAGALGVLAPLGRMTLTVYLCSTTLFLLGMKPFEGEIPLLAQYGIAAAYFVVMAFSARWWLGGFRLGPLEWVWRSLTYRRLIPMRRVRAEDARVTGGPERSEATELPR